MQILKYSRMSLIQMSVIWTHHLTKHAYTYMYIACIMKESQICKTAKLWQTLSLLPDEYGIWNDTLRKVTKSEVKLKAFKMKLQHCYCTKSSQYLEEPTIQSCTVWYFCGLCGRGTTVSLNELVILELVSEAAPAIGTCTCVISTYIHKSQLTDHFTYPNTFMSHCVEISDILLHVDIENTNH